MSALTAVRALNHGPEVRTRSCVAQRACAPVLGTTDFVQEVDYRTPVFRGIRLLCRFEDKRNDIGHCEVGLRKGRAKAGPKSDRQTAKKIV